MTAAEARQYATQILEDYNSGMAVKPLSKKYNMHYRHVNMILHEAGIDTKAEHNKRLKDGTYKEHLSHKKEGEEYDKWYVARFGCTKEEMTARRETEAMEKQRRTAMVQLIKYLHKASVIKEQEAREAERKRKEADKYAPKIAVCKYCGKEWKFIPDTGRYGRKNPGPYCSVRCRKKNNKQSSNIGHRLRAHGNGNKRRDIIRLKDLHKRDKGICQICGGLTDWNDITYDSSGAMLYVNGMYPTIDHIIPISHGGLHIWANVQLAHRDCNSTKRDRL